MSRCEPTRQSAAYVRGAVGQRFRLISEPPDGIRGTVLWAPAFAEEMNKSRRMCARMARSMAMRGWRVVQKDLLGCGDSSGEFGDASWSAWIDDLASELDQADRQRPAWLWCVRAGALFAPNLIARRPDLNLLLWQPALSGAQVLQQFLRLHAGARIVRAQQAQGRDATPAQLLRAGHRVEVAGYELTSALTSGLEQARFDLPDSHRGRVVWLEVSNAPQPTLSPAALDAAQRFRKRGVQVDHEVVAGPPFWHTQEIEDCDALLQRSIALLDGAGAP
jgi:exosortase A-associated hydrolase 2